MITLASMPSLNRFYVKTGQIYQECQHLPRMALGEFCEDVQYG